MKSVPITTKVVCSYHDPTDNTDHRMLNMDDVQ
jgi:hypothetical protein